jgi:hypothetical protein
MRIRFLRVFYISYISTFNGQEITAWARSRDGGRKSTWAWPVQQRPTSWKAWKLALKYLAPDGCVVPKLGEWLEQHHQQSEWYLDSDHNILYHHSNGTWEQHTSHSRARPCFATLATTCDRPASATHVAEANTRPRFVEKMDKCKILQHTSTNPPLLVPYTSNIDTCIETLPRHVKRLVGYIPAMRIPVGWYPTTPVDTIIFTDRSVTFGVGYHSWTVATADEDILLQGGGPDDGDLFLMQSYRSMERWHLPPDLWTTIEKVINHYKEHPHKCTANSTNGEPQKPFGVTLTTSRNLLHQAFRKQSHICWDNFLKGRISRDWLTHVHYNEEHSNCHCKSNDWSAKFTGGLWDHLKRMWKFWNDIYHQDNKRNIAQYKLEALERYMEKKWARHTELLPKLNDFQKQHFDQRQRIADLRYKSKKCWEILATRYLHDAETNRTGFTSDVKRILGWKTGVG